MILLLFACLAAAELTKLQLATMREKQRLQTQTRPPTVAPAVYRRIVDTSQLFLQAQPVSTANRLTLPPRATHASVALKPTQKPVAHKPHKPIDVPQHLAHRYNKRDDMHVAHCLGAADAQALERHKTDAAEKRLAPPRARILWPQIDVIEVEITLPYVADAFRYVLSFSPIQIDHVSDLPQVEALSECSSLFGAGIDRTESAFDTSDDQGAQTQEWTFAPNALHPDAFSADYTANYVSEDSIWRVHPVDCAHVRYTARIPLSQLLACENSATLVEAHNSTALLTSLHVTGLLAGHHSISYAHEYSMAVYSDSQGNAVFLFDSSSTNSTPLGTTLMRSLSITDDLLSLQLQTVSEHGNLRIGSVTPRYTAGTDGELATSPPLRPESTTADSYGSGQQNWDFDAELSETMFTGQYVIQFEPEHDPSETLLVGIMFRLDNAPAATDAQLAGIHGAVAQHDELMAHTGKFSHGDLVCMQSYVLLGDRLEQHIQVDLLEAILCPAEHDESCHSHKHSSLLFADGAPQRSDVSVVWPGAYGENSVALCFNASATLIDADRRARVFERQRYEARVQIRAHNAAARQASLSWKTEVAADSAPEHLKHRAKLIKSQIVKAGDFTSGNLERSLMDARAAALLEEYETQFTEFEVERSEELLYNVSNTDALVVTALVVAIVIVVLLVYALFVFSRERRVQAQLADTLDAKYRVTL
jgi:hypothetical protein